MNLNYESTKLSNKTIFIILCINYRKKKLVKYYKNFYSYVAILALCAYDMKIYKFKPEDVTR
jgi:REP element-mobilizing transposase RayT